MRACNVYASYLFSCKNVAIPYFTFSYLTYYSQGKMYPSAFKSVYLPYWYLFIYSSLKRMTDSSSADLEKRWVSFDTFTLDFFFHFMISTPKLTILFVHISSRDINWYRYKYNSFAFIYLRNTPGSSYDEVT